MVTTSYNIQSRQGSQNSYSAQRRSMDGLVRRSFSPTQATAVTPSGTGHPMKYGDKVYARLVLGGRAVAEFTTACVNDLTELFMELRRLTRGCRGLGHLFIRNMSRGWRIERPLMLYAGDRRSSSILPSYSVKASARQIMPWETH